MSWDIALAKKLKRQAAARVSGGSLSGTVVQASPLVVSACDGAIMLQGNRLQVSDAIGALQVGDTVCVVGNGPYTIVARM
ncbi:MAG: hypothetical protein Q4D42_03070 [Eubacteriales bacterium]|nr:hypothetical protein [Eubacteriales bacterium]